MKYGVIFAALLLAGCGGAGAGSSIPRTSSGTSAAAAQFDVEPFPGPNVYMGSTATVTITGGATPYKAGTPECWYGGAIALSPIASGFQVSPVSVGVCNVAFSDASGQVRTLTINVIP